MIRIPKISFYKFKKSDTCLKNWLFVKKQWGYKLWYIHIKRFCIILDFRENWIKDMGVKQ